MYAKPVCAMDEAPLAPRVFPGRMPVPRLHRRAPFLADVDAVAGRIEQRQVTIRPAQTTKGLEFVAAFGQFGRDVVERSNFAMNAAGNAFDFRRGEDGDAQVHLVGPEAQRAATFVNRGRRGTQADQFAVKPFHLRFDVRRGLNMNVVDGDQAAAVQVFVLVLGYDHYSEYVSAVNQDTVVPGCFHAAGFRPAFMVQH